MKSNSLVILDGQCQLSVSEGYAKETGRISCFKKVISSRLSTISSEKKVLRIAFAGCLETLSSQESASGAKIQLSERSEFCIFVPAFNRFLQA